MAESKLNDSAKLQTFARYVTNDASNRCEVLERELEEKWEQMINETEILLYEQAYEKLQRTRKELERMTNETISREKLLCKRNLSARRGEITDEVMDEVRTALDAFSKSEKYYPWLIKCARLAEDTLGSGDIVLYLNRSDMDLAQRLAADTGFEVEIIDAGGVVPGGMKAVNRDTHTVLNKTFDVLIEEQREEFLKISNL